MWCQPPRVSAGHASPSGAVLVLRYTFNNGNANDSVGTAHGTIVDPNVEVRWGRERYRPAGGSKIDTEAYAVLEAQTKKHYDTVVLPTMGTGATDMSNIRAKGIQCYGIGPAIDSEDGPKGFGAHSDQERILESELHRFVRFQYDVVLELARSR